MKRQALVVSTLLFAVGCKTDAAKSSAGSAAATASERTGTARSGKIELDRRPAPPAGSGDGEPQLDEARRDVPVEDYGQRLEREMAELDPNGDGKISPEERAAVRLKRAGEMRVRFDADGDGKVTVSEIGEWPMSRRFDDPALLDSDKNGDISAAELKTAMDQLRNPLKGPGRPRDDNDLPAGSGGATP